MSKYDPHNACREEIAFWREKHAEKDRVKQVVMEVDVGDPLTPETAVYKVLTIVRVDAFKDGLRVLVR